MLDEQRKRYREYLSSEHWTSFAKRIRQERGERCEICGCSGNDFPLNVHHLIYDHLGEPGESDDVILLCSKHHGNCHGGQVIIFSMGVDLNDYLDANGEPNRLLKDLLKTRCSRLVFLENRIMLTKQKRGKVIINSEGVGQTLEEDVYVGHKMPFRLCDKASDLIF